MASPSCRANPRGSRRKRDFSALHKFQAPLSLPSSKESSLFWVRMVSAGNSHLVRHSLGPCPPKQPHRGLGSQAGRALWLYIDSHLSHFAWRSPHCRSARQCSPKPSAQPVTPRNRWGLTIWPKLQKKTLEMEVHKTTNINLVLTWCQITQNSHSQDFK